MVRSIVTKYLVIKDAIHNIEKIPALFQLTLNKRCFSAEQLTKIIIIKYDLLLGLSNLIVYCFCFQTSEFLNFHSQPS